jgi:hypothetical protein
MNDDRTRVHDRQIISARPIRAASWLAAVWIGVLLTLATSGCISLNIGQQKGERSSGVRFDPPGFPFQPLEGGRADGAWQNRQNGNSISYLSSCDDPSDPALDLVMRDLFADFKDMKSLKRETTQFNGREAEVAEVEGLVDGVRTRVHAVVFKKNNCLYTLSYIGVAPSFEADHGRFEQFLGSFRAP